MLNISDKFWWSVFISLSAITLLVGAAVSVALFAKEPRGGRAIRVLERLLDTVDRLIAAIFRTHSRENSADEAAE
jgi:threonine/homoserine/homoserine lactone efflux protein